MNAKEKKVEEKYMADMFYISNSINVIKIISKIYTKFRLNKIWRYPALFYFFIFCT